MRWKHHLNDPKLKLHASCAINKTLLEADVFLSAVKWNGNKNIFIAYAAAIATNKSRERYKKEATQRELPSCRRRWTRRRSPPGMSNPIRTRWYNYAYLVSGYCQIITISKQINIQFQCPVVALTIKVLCTIIWLGHPPRQSLLHQLEAYTSHQSWSNWLSTAVKFLQFFTSIFSS